MYTRKQMVTLDTNRTRVTTPCNFYVGDYNSSILSITMYENGKAYEIKDTDKFRVYAKVLENKQPIPPHKPPMFPQPLPMIHTFSDVIVQDDETLVTKNPDASNTRKNVVEIVLGREIMDIDGVLEVEVEIYDNNGVEEKKASFEPFLIQILKNIENQ